MYILIMAHENGPTPEELGIVWDESESDVAGQIEFEDGNIPQTVEDLGTLHDLGSLVEFDLEPEPGTYKTSQVIMAGEAGVVTAKVSRFVRGSEEVLDSVTGVPLEGGELVVEIGSAGPITWESFKMLHEQSGGEHIPGITIGPEDLV